MSGERVIQLSTFLQKKREKQSRTAQTQDIPLFIVPSLTALYDEEAIMYGDTSVADFRRELMANAIASGDLEPLQQFEFELAAVRRDYITNNIADARDLALAVQRYGEHTLKRAKAINSDKLERDVRADLKVTLGTVRAKNVIDRIIKQSPR